MNKLYCGNCLNVLPKLGKIDCIFADPPDNIGLKYNNYFDNVDDGSYCELLKKWIHLFVSSADTVWLSFNVKWIIYVGHIISDFNCYEFDLEIKPCVQTFMFGQHNQHDLGNNYRPLWRFTHKNAQIYPDQIRVFSERQLVGDKRADPRGKVPGDVFDFPRVTGNSKQRRKWHPTQLHEDLVERCIKLSTKEGDTVCDPFAGTGTTLRVCNRINRNCITMDTDPYYCELIAAENNLILKSENLWE